MSEIDTTRAVLAAVLKERDALRAELETSQKQSAANFIRAREWAERSGKLEAELEASRAQWRPIETAPKDGNIFLCWVSAVNYGETDEGQQYQQDVSQADFCWWADGNDGNGYFDPACGRIADAQAVTHWMPLPAPPAAIASQAPAQEGAPASPSGA